MMPLSATANNTNPKYWFVGSVINDIDQCENFVREGRWENGYDDAYLDQVKSIKVDDKIAIKTSYTRKHNLPFDANGGMVSVMAIKAIGTVVENLGDGRNLKVDWQLLEKPREWYFYTFRNTITRALAGEDNWTADALVDFTFNNKPQDYDRFRNEPYWKERFGDRDKVDMRFQWINFYSKVADKLLKYKNNRDDLIKGIHQIADSVENGLSHLNDSYSDGSMPPLKDICPFTVMGIFNRKLTNANRIIIATKLADFLGVSETVPNVFDGIPVLNNQKSWFFGFAKDRKDGDIDCLWGIFEEAIKFADSESEDKRDFIDAYNKATSVLSVGWNLTMGLYWIRAWSYPTLDSQSREYIEKKLNIDIGTNGDGNRCNATDYFSVRDKLEARFGEEHFPVHSFPELSLAAYQFQDSSKVAEVKSGYDKDLIPESELVDASIPLYMVEDIMSDGCFFEIDKVSKILERLRSKKNLILQGSPGTGKTWLAKRLAFALMGKKDVKRLKAVQFHPNLSYEDFVRGWRPTGDGKLKLVDGALMKVISDAIKNPNEKHVIVIEEINRGNPSQILGEMLTLLEADKRTPSEALELSYCKAEGETVYIPDNLYVIGTMNIADRSLALVDLALRRRFAFIDLEPTFGIRWRNWVSKKSGIEEIFLMKIEKKISTLNEEITNDSSLGSQFKIGHSYLTPAFNYKIEDPIEWFSQVVETEIAPLLDEYWFDNLDKSQKAQQQLVEGII